MPTDVREYYNRNTRGFLRLGGATRRTGSLHRSLRLPGGPRGFGSRVAAERVHAVHAILLEILREYGVVSSTRAGGTPEPDPISPSPAVSGPATPPRIADLGCGVGASMEWLARRATLVPLGMTLSPVQAEIATRRLGAEDSPSGGGNAAASVITGSFTEEADIRRLVGEEKLHGAYMIESFVHGNDPAALFSGLARHSLAGAPLIICDDFPGEALRQEIDADAPPTAPSRRRSRHARMAADFRRGWHIHSFLTPEELVPLAATAGWQLVERRDLSPYVVTNRPRDILARMSAPVVRALGGRGSWWENVIGGAALQGLIRRGLVRYQILVFRRR